MPIEDIANPAGITGALTFARNKIDEGIAAVAAELDTIPAADLERALVAIGEAQKALASALVNAAAGVNK